MKIYLYKITNIINGKIYVGIHKTKDLEDGYMGSGKMLKDAIKKYGIDNFKKEIIEFFEDYNSALEKEKEIVNEEFIKRNDTYNLRLGGYGGFDYLNRNGYNIIGINNRTSCSFEKMSVGAKKSVKIQKEKKIGIFSEEFVSKGKDEEFMKMMQEKSLSKESREKRKQTMKENKHQQGEKHSQYGTMWISDGTRNKKIKKEETIPEGWFKGRKM